MVSRKYLNDYRVEQKTDTDGKTRSEAVYIGGDFILSPSVTVKDKRLILCMSVLPWIAFICALLPVTASFRKHKKIVKKRTKESQRLRAIIFCQVFAKNACVTSRYVV